MSGLTTYSDTKVLFYSVIVSSYFTYSTVKPDPQIPTLCKSIVLGLYLLNVSSCLTCRCHLHNITSLTIKECDMGLPGISGLIGGIISIVAGIIVLIKPQIIAWVLGIFLIIFGISAVIAVL